MKKQKVSQLMVLTLSLELILSPVALASGPTKEDPERSGTADLALGLLSITSGVVNKLQQKNIRDGSYYTDLAGFTMQQTPMQDKYFSANKLMQLPGLANYLALNNLNPAALHCKTLPTTLHEAEPEVCRVGVLSDNAMGVEGQLAQAFGYAEQYHNIDKLYRNFSSTSNVSGQDAGIGCMDNAMKVLQGYFAYRIDELDKLTTNLEALNNQFKEASKADLNAIEESTAVLEGGNSDFVNKIKNSRPDLFDFANKFNNPACMSIMSGQEFNERGGLNNISKDLKTQLTTKPSGNFSGENYLNNHHSVVADIKKMANDVAKQVELNFSDLVQNPGQVNSLFSVSTNHGLEKVLKGNLIADQQMSFVEKNKKLQSEISIIASELNLPKDSSFTREVSNPHSGAFNSQLTTIETSIKNGCLKRAVDVNSLIKNVHDATSSDFANKNASSFLKDKLQQIIGNDKTSFDKKIAELQAIEKQYANYYVKMQNSYEVQEVDAKGNLITKVVPATAKRTPSAYLSDVIRSCEAQFKSNHLNNQVTGADAVKRLRSIHNEYKSLAKSHANNIKNDITSKLIECKSEVQANTAATSSCNPEVFNTEKPTFCANAAVSCSKNMKQCSEQAEKFVKDIKTDRTARINNYKQMVEKNKKDIIQIFDSALSQYMKEGEHLRSLFGAGFTSPQNIKRGTEGEEKYIASLAGISSEVDGKILLEDPDKFLEIFKRNMKELKDNVAKQQKEIVDGTLKAHIAQTKQNYDKVAKDASIFAQKCQQKYDGYVQGLEKIRGQQQKELQELGEKGAEFCSRWSGVARNPFAACQSDFTDLGKIAAKVDPRAAADVQSLSIYCAGQNMGGDNSKGDARTLCRAQAHLLQEEDKIRCKTLLNKDKCDEKVELPDGNGNTRTVMVNECETLEKNIIAAFNVAQNARSKDGAVTNSYCTASNGSESSNKTLNFLNGLARELGVKPASTAKLE